MTKLPIICDCRPVAGVIGLLDAWCSTLARLPGCIELEWRGTIMFGVNDRSSMLQPATVAVTQRPTTVKYPVWCKTIFLSLTHCQLVGITIACYSGVCLLSAFPSLSHVGKVQYAKGPKKTSRNCYNVTFLLAGCTLWLS